MNEAGIHNPYALVRYSKWPIELSVAHECQKIAHIEELERSEDTLGTERPLDMVPSEERMWTA